MNRIFAATALLLVAVSLPLLAADADDPLLQIEQMAALGEKADPSLGQSIVDAIERNPADIVRALAPKLEDRKLSDQQLAVYAWALGLAKDPKSVSAIEALHGRSDSDRVRSNCLRALARIGGLQAEAYLLFTLDATTDGDRRFEILDCLGELQCEAALPRTEEVLRQDFRELYWRSVFVFGKMGDKAVPFLLQRINDKDRNIRANVISLAGQWLVAPEAATPMQERFWIEPDPELRVIILSSLERTINDLAQMKAVFEQVVARERDGNLLKFARETLDNMDRMKADVEAFAREKRPSAASFQREYNELFKSAGKKGSYEVLGISSAAEDEPKLKALRERILQRDSDEAFYDFQKVTGIIVRNRLAQGLETKEPCTAPGAGDGK